jgi:hypothetical protein
MGSDFKRDDPLLRREPLIWGGSNDAVAALNAQAQAILKTLPVRPATTAGATTTGTVAAIGVVLLVGIFIFNQ